MHVPACQRNPGKPLTDCVAFSVLSLFSGSGGEWVQLCSSSSFVSILVLVPPPVVSLSFLVVYHTE